MCSLFNHLSIRNEVQRHKYGSEKLTPTRDESTNFYTA